MCYILGMSDAKRPRKRRMFYLDDRFEADLAVVMAGMREILDVPISRSQALMWAVGRAAEGMRHDDNRQSGSPAASSSISSAGRGRRLRLR